MDSDVVHIDFSKNNLSLYNKTANEEYKTRLATALLKNGIATDYFNEEGNTDIKLYVTNFVNDVITERANRDRIMGITYKLAQTSIHNSESEVLYPVINKYQGHLLIETYYFALEGNEVKTEVVPFSDKGPLIIN